MTNAMAKTMKGKTVPRIPGGVVETISKLGSITPAP